MTTPPNRPGSGHGSSDDGGGEDPLAEMLRKMFIGDPPGNYDRLLDFTTAVTGAQFFTPTLDFLEDLPPAPDAAPTESPTPTTRSDGSLGIGSLH